MTSESKYGATSSQEKLLSTKAQVDTVVDIMRDNVEKVLQRDELIGDLETKAVTLEDNSRYFLRASKKLKMKMCCQNAKMWLILAVVIVILITIIAVIIAKK
jgi:hypothetical protein